MKYKIPWWTIFWTIIAIWSNYSGRFIYNNLEHTFGNGMTYGMLMTTSMFCVYIGFYSLLNFKFKKDKNKK